MKKLRSAISGLSENQLVAFIAGLGMLIAMRVIYIQHGWINNDSVLYFEAARLFSEAQWKEGFALYNWPLYPGLLALLHTCTSMSIQHAAQLLNVLFFGITTYSFATLIRIAGGSKITIACGSFLLLSSPYIVGDVLPMLLRDEGFWAFFLTSLVFFIRFYRDGRPVDAFRWQVAAMLAVLFRIEAVTFLVALPFVIISNNALSRRQAIVRALQASVLTLSVMIFIVVVLVLIPGITLSDFGRIQELSTIFSQAYLQVTQGLEHKAQIMGELVLGNYLEEYGTMSLLLSLTGIVFYKIASTAGWATSGLLMLSARKKTEGLSADAGKIFLWVSMLALVNAIVIIISTFVLSSRYVIALTFMLMIFASFTFAPLFQPLPSKLDTRKYWLLTTLLLILTLSCLKNLLPNGAEHNYQQSAAAWINTHSQPANSVFIDNARVRYYAQRAYAGRGDEWELVLQGIKDGSIHHYDFLLISLNADHPEREQYLVKTLTSHHLAKKFNKEKSDKAILIFVRN